MQFHSCPRSHAAEIHAGTGALLCVPCTRQLERHLRAIPGLYQECLHHISPTSRRGNPTKVSGSRKRDHLNITALDVRSNVLAILESWSGTVVEERGNISPTRSVPHLARFLISNLGWLTAQSPSADFADEIAGVHTELLRTIDAAPDDLHPLIRACAVDDCTGMINASPQNSGNAGKTSISCSSGHSWEMREWLTLRHLMDRQRKEVA